MEPRSELLAFGGDEKNKQEYNQVIYELDTKTLDVGEVRLVTTALKAMTGAGYDLIVSISQQQTGHIEVRTKKEYQDKRLESALLTGLVEALRNYQAEQAKPENSGSAKSPLEDMAHQFLHQVTDSSTLFHGFQQYFSGISSNQEYLEYGLIVAATEYDHDWVEQHLTSKDLELLIMNIPHDDIPYKEYSEWSKKSLESIFKRCPQLDYRRLADADFRANPEGKKLEKLYSEFIGEKKAELFKRTGDVITEEGAIAVEPIVPLSTSPMVEGLVLLGLNLERPRGKYDFLGSDKWELANEFPRGRASGVSRGMSPWVM